MSETKYKLCKRAGLTIWNDAAWADHRGKGFNADMIDAVDVEKLLEGAPVVSTYNVPDVKWYVDEPVDVNDTNYTHTARLVMIEPVVKDTAEQFVKDLISHADKFPGWEWATKTWIDRARRLLGVK